MGRTAFLLVEPIIPAKVHLELATIIERKVNRGILKKERVSIPTCIAVNN